ncbi:hypothetical protein GDO86_020118 [Hymenochirus boettgeri]|nr:hypothetical protein GDO86_020118 [Hymenochirus boettgeri]
MTNLTDRLLHEHVLRIDCRDGVQIICNTEQEGKTVLALLLSEAFLITQLQTGEMYCIWDLIFIWSKLQLKTNPSKQAFVESCYQMLRIATNIKVIFPFIKTVINEVGEVGVQLAVELCGCALQLDLNEQPETKSLIYKTIAYLLPTDLEICRVCVLSVFFLERSIESYSAVERLYRCLDEDYNEFTSHVENRVRFELLPILKRGLLFDPEFWNFPMIQKKCAALLGEKAAMLSTNTLNTKVQETLNSVTSRMDLRNGVIGHRVLSGAKCENPIDKKSTLPILGSYKIDHNVPIHQCTLCNKEILGGHIFRHAQAHQKKGCFSCVLCSRKFRNRVKMLKHLKNHIKKMQIQPMTPSSSLDTNEINTSDPSRLSLENGNSSSSTNDTVMETPSSDATCQDHLPNPIVSSENHLSDCDTLKERHSEDLNTSANILSTILPVQQSLGNDLSACIKINGSLCPASVNEMVKEEGNYKCPAWGCFRLFKKIRSLNKHARIAHPNDIKVQQHLMKSNKGKCRFCQRRFADSKHFFDHLNRHVYPDVYFCQHLNCNIKFKLRTQLAEHILSHESFQAKCSYGHCPELFEDLSKLHEHECQHYKNNLNDSVTCLPDAGLVDNDLVSNTVTGVASLDHFPSDCAPLGKSMVGHALSENGSLGDLLDLLPSTENLPGICRSIADSVKENELLDLPVPVWKSRKDIVEPKTYLQTEKKVNGDIQSMNGTSQDRLNPLQPPVLEKICAVERNVCNDHEKTVERTIILDTVAPNAETVMKASSLAVIAPESSQESSADGNACNSKKSPVSFDQAYGGTVKRPYIRLLPPSYLDEQYISMPKRRKADERLPSEKDSMSKKSSERFRCGKCLTNYSSAEALNEHQAQKKCQLYFGFDSDDESAW